MLAERVGKAGRVIALDRDAGAIARAETQLAGLAVMVAQRNFCDAPEVIREAGYDQVDGILLDLGLSSDQLADEQRGFSFDSEGPLDLRFDTDEGQPAWRLLAAMREENLANIIYEFGEERCSRRIAREIVARRKSDPVKSARDLAEVCRRCIPRGKGPERIHPATRTFQALRIAVNEELRSLDLALKRLPELLSPGGRIAIVSFHSLEDRRVKNAFRDDQRTEVLTRKPVQAGEAELDRNPRSRSAKLRVAQRCNTGALARSGNEAPGRSARATKDLTIISGGQTGVDRGALDAAIALNIPHAGWCPAGRKAEDGEVPDRYALQETDSAEYHQRTERNVVESDATLILFRGEISGGTKLTHRFAVQHSRPFLLVDIAQSHAPEEIRNWLKENRINRLNVAGPRESNEPGIAAQTKELLLKALRQRLTPARSTQCRRTTL